MGCCASNVGESTFKIEVKTGDRLNSGTDANVKIILKDSNGIKTDELVLDKFFRNDFEKGNTDTFPVKTPSHYCSDVVEVEFWRDDAGLASDWYVDKITIENLKTHERYDFPVFRWIKANYHYIIRHLDTSLPQHDPHPEQRKMELSDKKRIYEIIQKIKGGPAQVGIHVGLIGPSWKHVRKTNSSL